MPVSPGKGIKKVHVPILVGEDFGLLLRVTRGERTYLKGLTDATKEVSGGRTRILPLREMVITSRIFMTDGRSEAFQLAEVETRLRRRSYFLLTILLMPLATAFTSVVVPTLLCVIV